VAEQELVKEHEAEEVRKNTNYIRRF